MKKFNIAKMKEIATALIFLTSAFPIPGFAGEVESVNKATSSGTEITESAFSSFKALHYSDPSKTTLKIVVQQKVTTSCTDLYLKTKVVESQILFRKVFIDAQPMRDNEVGCVFAEKKERVIKSDVITLSCVPEKFSDGSDVCVGIDADIVIPSTMQIMTVE